MEPRSIPKETSFEALFAPARDHPYLRDASRHPFRQVDGFESANAWWLAELSLLSYVPEEEFVRDVVARAGLGDATFLEAESTHCVLVGDFVVFRGTDDLRDLLTDLDTALVAEGPGRVHRGFQAALDLIWDELARSLGGRRVYFAGHSLGAALATLAAARHPAARAVYTFGSPRVGDVAFGESITATVHRIVNNNDVVTRVPPPVSFRHVGELHYLDDRGRLRADPGLWERVREQALGHGTRALENVKKWLAGDLRAIPYDSLVDHAPIHYVTHLWNHHVADLTEP